MAELTNHNLPLLKTVKVLPGRQQDAGDMVAWELATVLVQFLRWKVGMLSVTSPMVKQASLNRTR